MDRLAWAEYVVPSNEYRLVAYRFATGETQVLVPELPLPFADAGFFPMAELEWSSTGIALVNGAINNVGEYTEILYVYDDTGALISETLVGSSETEQVWAWHWVRVEDEDAIAVWYPSGKQQLVDPRTTAIEEMPGTPQRVATLAPGSSLALSMSPTTLSDGNLAPVWTLTAPDGFQVTLDFNGHERSIALAPNGQEIALLSDALIVSGGGQLNPVPGTEGIEPGAETAVVWGPTAWRIGDAVPAPPDDGPDEVVCSPAPRLTVGSYGQVTPGLPNIIRTLPRRGEGSGVVGRIPANGVFQVVSGPACDTEGRYWWEVDYQGLRGWTPEGEGTTYWLAPYTPGTPTQPIVCNPAPRLRVGQAGFVLPGQPNILRDQPRRGPGSNIIGRLPGGTFFTVLDGPQCDPEGRYWWHIRAQGLTGWTAEGEDNTYWVSPFGCPASPAPRLVPGDQGRVTPGDPNTLRSEPSASAAAVGQIPAGGVFVVLSGPQCGAEGWTWWRVNYGGQVGWTAEGQGADYWLEPFSGTPTDPGQPTACEPTPRLQPGISAFVPFGLPNLIRSEPSPNATVIGEMPGGSFFRVLAGPQCGSDGRTWWQIRFEGTTGWTAEGEGATYWVSPFNCPSSPPARLIPGQQAQVTPGDANVLRGAPGTGADSPILDTIPGGGVFDVLGPPQCGNDGRTWWRVNYLGMIGWTAEGDGDTYWLRPIG